MSIKPGQIYLIAFKRIFIAVKSGDTYEDIIIIDSIWKSSYWFSLIRTLELEYLHVLNEYWHWQRNDKRSMSIVYQQKMKTTRCKLSMKSIAMIDTNNKCIYFWIRFKHWIINIFIGRT